MKSSTVYTKILGYAKLLSLTALLLGTAIGSVGCSKDSGGGGSNAGVSNYGYNNGGLYGYGTNGSIAAAVGDYGNPSYPDAELMLQFSGNNTSSNGYVAQVAAAGTLYISGNAPCGFTPGMYSIQTQQPGQISGPDMQNLALVATNGSSQIQILVYSASLNSTPYTQSGIVSHDVSGNSYAYRFVNFAQNGIVLQSAFGSCAMNFY